jgi:hypothetical protein
MIKILYGYELAQTYPRYKNLAHYHGTDNDSPNKKTAQRFFAARL